MKIIITLVVLFAATFAEPPVDNRYLPPQQGSSGGFASPSQVYGAAGSGNRQQTDAIFRARPSSASGTTFSQRSNLRRPSNQYLTPSNQYNAPSQQYGAPRSSPNSAGVQIPSAQYGAPSEQYGVPGLGSDNGIGSGLPGTYEGANRQYLPPGRTGYSGDDGNNGEPANYNFEYTVEDIASGNDYGHREARQGDRAEGLYYVLLPDGRKQIVEYEADQNGYKPRISYQDTGLKNGGYGRVNQGYSDGYPAQGPY